MKLFTKVERFLIPGTNGTSYEHGMFQYILSENLSKLFNSIVPSRHVQWAIFQALKNIFEDWLTSSLQRNVESSIPTLSLNDQNLEVLSFVGYGLHDMAANNPPGVKKNTIESLFTIKAEGGNDKDLPVAFNLINRGGLKIVTNELLPWGQAIIYLVRTRVTPQKLLEKSTKMLDSAWKEIHTSQCDGVLGSLFYSSWTKVFKDDPTTRDNIQLRLELAADLSSKTFHSRAKECLVGFKMRNCGRGAQKDSTALRTRLKSTTGGDTMIPEEEKLSRQTILESSFQKAVEQAEDGKNKRRQETSGPYKTKADNQKEEHRKKIAKHLKFDFNTAQELSPAQEEEEAV